MTDPAGASPRNFVFAGTLLFVLVLSLGLACAQDNVPYSFYEEKGIEALKEGRYLEAKASFEDALAVNPSAVDSLYFSGALQRLEQNKEDIESFEILMASLQKEAFDLWEKKHQDKEQAVAQALAAGENDASSKETIPPPKTPETKIAAPKKKDAPAETKKAISREPELLTAAPDKILLDDSLWSAAAKPDLNIEIGKSVILEGKDIERFLVVIPGFITVERLDRDRIKVKADKRGKTVFLVWENHGRWSFNIEAIFPIQRTVSVVKKDVWQEQSEPFRFSYASDWGNFYSDDGTGKLTRRSKSFIQHMAIDGPTPYGDLDSYVIMDRVDSEFDVTGYSLGLENGCIGPLKDFRIRGFDVKRYFSDLTLSSKYVRGVLWEHNIFDHNLTYTFLTGRSKSSFGYLSPGIVGSDQDFFVSGARTELFPKGKHRYVFNYAQGSGDDRPSDLKERAMSVQTFHDFERAQIDLEVAHAQQELGLATGLKYELAPDLDLSANFRDIDKDYTTVTENPPRQGEIGTILSASWNPRGFSIDSIVDIYRSRLNLNPNDQEAYNYDGSVSINKVLDPTSSFSTNLYYSHTPGLASPQRNFRVYNAYAKNFQLADNRIILASIGQSYQRSRFSYSPLSEYDRLGAFANIRVPVLRGISYYLNYEHYWVEEIAEKDRIQPHVVTTGFNYAVSLTESLSGRMDLSYRREDETESPLSFLAGEDSAGATVGVTYRPNPDINLYLDGSSRNIWPKDKTRDEYFETDIRCGARLAWELPIAWNPDGYVAGVVFKDVNGNQVQDPGEEGLSGVSLQVGKQKATTGDDGRYFVHVKAKRVQAGLDLSSVPKGYIPTTPLLKNVDIATGKVVAVNFGLTTQSNIYGVVYADSNNNQTLDESDERMTNVKVVLDGTQEVSTDFEGAYSFSGIAAGKHVISFDVNTIPVEYIPLIKIKSEVEVQEGTTYIFYIPVKRNQ